MLAKIDSFKLSIPINDESVKIYSPTLLTKISNENVTMINKHGEILEDDMPLSTLHLVKIDRGIKYRAQVRAVPRSHLKYLQIGINAKQLGYEYFKGISRFNISDVLGQFEEIWDVKFNEQYVLHNSFVTDLDVCFDYEQKLDEFKIMIKELKDISIHSPKLNEGYSSADQQKNVGIWWGNRDLKFYKKDIELKHNSLTFYHEFFLRENKKCPNYVRIEANIKGSADLKTLGIEDNKLFTVLDHQDFLIDIFSKKASKYLASRIIKKRERKYESAKSKVIYLLAMELMTQGWMIQDVTTLIEKNFLGEERHKRKRIIDELISLMQDALNDNKLLRVLNTHNFPIVNELLFPMKYWISTEI